MKCRVPELNKFLCCIQLEIGTKIIAYLNMICFIIVLMYELRMRTWSYKNRIGTKYFSVHLELDDTGLSLQVIFGIYLLIGLYEKKPVLLFAWVLFEASTILISIMLIINSIIIAIINHIERNRSYAFVNPNQVINECIFTVAYTYFCLVMNSWYKKMNRNKNDKQENIRWRNDSTAVR